MANIFEKENIIDQAAIPVLLLLAIFAAFKGESSPPPPTNGYGASHSPIVDFGLGIDDLGSARITINSNGEVFLSSQSSK